MRYGPLDGLPRPTFGASDEHRGRPRSDWDRGRDGLGSAHLPRETTPGGHLTAILGWRAGAGRLARVVVMAPVDRDVMVAVVFHLLGRLLLMARGLRGLGRGGRGGPHRAQRDSGFQAVHRGRMKRMSLGHDTRSVLGTPAIGGDRHQETPSPGRVIAGGRSSSNPEDRGRLLKGAGVVQSDRQWAKSRRCSSSSTPSTIMPLQFPARRGRRLSPRPPTNLATGRS